MPCRVNYIESRLGKSPFALKNTIYQEYDNFLSHMSNYLPELLNNNADFVKYFESSGLLDSFADQFILSLPSPRS
jgi:hypothetical protein